MNYPDDDEIIRIMKTYGVVKLYMDNGIDKCSLRSYWEAGMPRVIKYFRTNTQYLSNETPIRSSYYDLYHEMLNEVFDV
jgi:hypothetical protein